MPLVADVPRALYHANKAGKNLLFEGAQGALLDIDHGTYPYVTSSNCVAGAAAAGAGIGPMHLHYVLGITKAYTTRVGEGPFPTELSDDVGERLRQRGQEFGATTGRPRRTGWFDAAALKRSMQLNGVSGLCITKLDVLDGAETLKICVGYDIDGKVSDILPVGAEELELLRAGVRGDAGLAGEHGRRQGARQAAQGRARLSGARRKALRRADRLDFHRPGARRDHRPAPSLHALSGREGAAPIRAFAPPSRGRAPRAWPHTAPHPRRAAIPPGCVHARERRPRRPRW